MSLKTVGLLSPGDMGHVVGKVLKQNGLQVLTCLEGRSDRTRRLAEISGVEAVSSYHQLVKDVSLIISILVPAEAKNVAQSVGLAIKDTGEKIVYADCNAISPETSKQLDVVISEVGSKFVDAGIIGGPPRQKGITRFYCSGPDTSMFEELGNYGLDVRVAGQEIGQASGLKMCYAASTKGYTALCTELLIAAKKMGLYERLVEEFQLSQEARYRSMESGLPGMPTKARRWIGEMEEIAKTFEDLGLTPKIYQGAADVFRMVGETSLAEETPETQDKSRTLAQMVKLLTES